VQIKFDASKRQYTLFSRVTPETSIRMDPYPVEIVTSFDDIKYIRCYGCVAQRGNLDFTYIVCQYFYSTLMVISYLTKQGIVFEIINLMF
jgi:hypothetical protein